MRTCSAARASGQSASDPGLQLFVAKVVGFLLSPRAIRTSNGNLTVWPIYHGRADRVEAHFFICMLAHYLEWHLIDRLTPLLFVDENKPAAQAVCSSPVARAQRSAAGKAKDATKRNTQDRPIHSPCTLFVDLATLCPNRIEPTDPALPPFNKLTVATPFQRQALELLGVPPRTGIA